MSNPFYKLLETFDELEEAMPTKVKKIGNQVEVDDGEGNKTMYDQESYAELQAAENELEEAKSGNARSKKQWTMPPFKPKGSNGISKDRSGTGEFQGEKQNAAYVPNKSNAEDPELEEGFGDDIKRGAKKAGKWMKRGMQGWDMDYAYPDEMVKRHAEYDTDTLHNLEEPNRSAGKQTHSPADLQQKLINRELRRRGERDFKKYGDSRKMTDDINEGLQGYDDFTYTYEDNEEEEWVAPEAEIDDNLFSDPNYTQDYDNGGWGDELGDDDIGMDFNFESDEGIEWPNEVVSDEFPGDNHPDEYNNNDFDEPEYETFDLKQHGRRLRPGTPIRFSDDIGGGEGTFIEKSPSGAFGTAERNGKTISLHLNDIEEADLQNSSIYENFNKQFNRVMEAVTVVRTNNSEQPENDTITITGTEEHTDMLAGMMKLAGLEGGDGVELPQDAEIPMNISPEMEPSMEPSMGDMMGMMDEPISGREEMEGVYEEYAPEKKDDDEPYQNYKKDETNDHYDKKTGKWSKSNEEELEEDYANEPNDADECIADVDAQLNGMSGGLNKRKKMFKKGYPGDNEMTAKLDESDEVTYPPKYDEKESARKHGKEDAEAGRERKNASDIYGPFAQYYTAGYNEGKKPTNESKESFLNLYKKINDISNAG